LLNLLACHFSITGGCSQGGWGGEKGGLLGYLGSYIKEKKLRAPAWGEGGLGGQVSEEKRFVGPAQRHSCLIHPGVNVSLVSPHWGTCQQERSKTGITNNTVAHQTSWQV